MSLALAAPALDARYAAILERCRDDPVRFARTVLGWRTKDLNALVCYQQHIARLVAQYKTTIVPAGNSVGKSRLAACLIAWWLLTRPGSQVLVTAPSANLIGSVIFKELRRLLKSRGLLLPLGGIITQSMKASPQTWDLGEGWGCIGFSTTTVERASGQHNPHLLVIVDEASGIEDQIWEAIHSWKYSKLVCFGNPLRASGEFPKLFVQSRQAEELALPADERTVSFVVSSTDSPHVHLKKSPCGLADAGFLRTIERRYGRDSLYWRLHIALDKDNPFPTQDHDQLIPTEWVDRCVSVKREVGGARVLACDVAKGTGRDRTVIAVGDKGGAHLVWQSANVEIPQVAVMIRQLSEQFGVAPYNVVYDAGGATGDNLDRYLSAQGYGHARKYLGGTSGGPRFKNKRSWAAWKLRTRLDPDLPAARPYRPADPTMPLYHGQGAINPTPTPQPAFHIPMGTGYWAELREELLGLRYGYDGKLTTLERKEDFQARLGRSPDLADAFLMLMYGLHGEEL